MNGIGRTAGIFQMATVTPERVKSVGLHESLREYEQDLILDALLKHKFSLSQAARELDIHPSTLTNRMRQLEMKITQLKKIHKAGVA